jgi:hypothetical protein
MPRHWLALLVLLMAGVATPCAAGDRLAIIASPDAHIGVSGRTALAQIYRSKVLLDDRGTRIVPVNLPAGHPLREAFSMAVLGRRSQDLQSYWNEQYFHGIRPPNVVDSEEAMLRFVAATDGALGYVQDCRVDERVRVISYIELPANTGIEACATRR